MRKKIVLITSGQPSVNPRLVKEADSLSSAGYDVTVLYAYWNNWATAFDETLLVNKKWTVQRVGGHPSKSGTVFFLSRLLHKIAAFIAGKTGFSYFTDWAIARSSFWLIREAIKHPADLYIAHNLGALPAAASAAKRHKKPFGFDAEDFHRNEVTDDKTAADYLLKSKVEDKYIPLANYLTASSPQIALAYGALYKDKNPVVLLNVFNVPERLPAVINNIAAPLKLFWFSQTIGPKRGIEDVLNALYSLKNISVELHLLGNATDVIKAAYSDQVKDTASKIYFHEPIHPDEIILYAAQFDIGLALEPGFCANNNFAISNKIFSYMQAGLAIVASNTPAQQYLLQRYPQTGKVYAIGDAGSLADIITEFNTERDLLSDAKKASRHLGQTTLNWETESQKFLKIVEQTLGIE